MPGKSRNPPERDTWGSRGRRFKSCQPDNMRKGLSTWIVLFLILRNRKSGFPVSRRYASDEFPLAACLIDGVDEVRTFDR